MEQDRKPEEREIDRLYAIHGAELLEYARTLVSNEEVARKAVRDAFYRYALRLRDNPNFDGGYRWLASVLSYILINEIGTL